MTIGGNIISNGATNIRLNGNSSNVNPNMKETYNTQLLSNPLSYYTLITERKKFIRSGTRSGSEFNYFDNPSKLYFKIMFYFWNTDVDGLSSYTGLLAPSWLLTESVTHTDIESSGKASTKVEDQEKNARGQVNISRITTDTSKVKTKTNTVIDYWRLNSAWGYLMNNNELERAEMLKEFVNLLSNISSESPWYFQEISGLDEALKRNLTPKFEQERKKISIKCLPDAVDNRIGTLLDLYKAIVWSWQMKREVVPANLRKFDMGIFLYSTPIRPLHDYPAASSDAERYAHLSSNTDGYRTSYKYIEFHNCEFVYNSFTSGMSGIKNDTGFSPEYTIDIEFDDCYEQRYNEFMLRYIGDMVEWDVLESNADMSGFKKDSYSMGEAPDADQQNTMAEERINADLKKFAVVPLNDLGSSYVSQRLAEMRNAAAAHNISPTFGGTVMKELFGAGERYLSTKLSHIVLGNLNTYSIPKIASQLENASKGRVFETIDAIKSYTKKPSKKIAGTGIKKTPSSQGKALGNIYRSQTIANNL